MTDQDDPLDDLTLNPPLEIELSSRIPDLSRDLQLAVAAVDISPTYPETVSLPPLDLFESWSRAMPEDPAEHRARLQRFNNLSRFKKNAILRLRKYKVSNKFHQKVYGHDKP